MAIWVRVKSRPPETAAGSVLGSISRDKIGAPIFDPQPFVVVLLKEGSSSWTFLMVEGNFWVVGPTTHIHTKASLDLEGPTHKWSI